MIKCFIFVDIFVDMSLKHFNHLITGVFCAWMTVACGQPAGQEAKQQAVPANAAYKNANLSAERRADDLLKRMTIEEKLGQLLCPLGWPMYEKVALPALTGNGEALAASSQAQAGQQEGYDVRISDAYRTFIQHQHGGMLWATLRADPWTATRRGSSPARNIHLA